MRKELRTNKNGDSYYSFVGADRKRMSREEIRTRFGHDIITEEKADECLKLLGAADELTRARIQKRLAWEKEFYNFTKLLEQYTTKQKKRAPNSWQNNVFYLKHYVLFYFLQFRRLNNIELWSDNYEKFTEWLETAKTVSEKRKIAVSSRNHAIKSLNTFMLNLYQEKLITNYRKCESFGEHLVNKRTVDDIVSRDEMEKVFKELLQLGYATEANYFRFLYFTGMRFNEGLAISVGDLFDGEIESEFFRKKMKAYNIKYYGYLVSDSQFGGLNSNGEVIRLPFKGKKNVEEKYNRTIPIIDKVLWNSLIDTVELKLNGHPKVTNRRNILLFEGLDDSTASVRLQTAFRKAKLKYRSWHCLRHSRATDLIGTTADVMLARIWLGHSSPRTIEKYNHIYQSFARDAKRKAYKGNSHNLKRAN